MATAKATTKATGRSTKALAAAMNAQAEVAAEMLKAMAHPQRLRVLCLLVEGERSVGEINRDIELSQSALSQHLAILRSEGLVNTRKSSQTVYYALAEGPVLALIQTLHDAYCAQPRAKKPVERKCYV